MRKVFGGLWKVLAVVLLTVLAVLLNALCACAILAYGPSTEWQRRFVATFDETSAMKFVPRIFLSEDKVQAILHPGPEQPEENPFVELTFENGTQNGSGGGQKVVIADPPAEGEQWMEIVDIRTPTYRGKLVKVRDPSLVVIGMLDTYGYKYQGLYLTEFMEKYNAVVASNAGGFVDPHGTGNGGQPDGLAIRDGELIWGSADESYNDVIGFDANYILHVGDMTGQEALDLGLVTAISFGPGPVLIQDGQVQPDLGGGVNPRTCLGQTADGTVLLFVVEGRRPDSLGATYDDLAQVMYEHGAVNAGNLDGGSSSDMYYQDEQIIWNSFYTGARRIPNAILVLDGGAVDG